MDPDVESQLAAVEKASKLSRQQNQEVAEGYMSIQALMLAQETARRAQGALALPDFQK